MFRVHTPITIRTVHTTYAATLKTTTHPKTRCRKPYAGTQHLMLLMMGVCTRNMSSKECINKITLLHQVGISDYFMRKMHGQTTLKEINIGKSFSSCINSLQVISHATIVQRVKCKPLQKYADC